MPEAEFREYVDSLCERLGVPPEEPRPCARCGSPLPPGVRRNRLFCSGRCKIAAWRARRA
jgi:hypothetical protein